MQSTEAGYEFHASSTSICKIEFFFSFSRRIRWSESSWSACLSVTEKQGATPGIAPVSPHRCTVPRSCHWRRTCGAGVGFLLQFLLVSVNASSASLHASFPVGGACSPAHAPCRCCLLMLSVWNKSSPEVLQIQGRNADTRLFFRENADTRLVDGVNLKLSLPVMY